MALAIRLRQQGRKNRETYRLVVTDSRSPRDGKYVEMLGWYNPSEKKEELTLSIKVDRVQHWIEQGAQLTDRARALVAQQDPMLILQQTQKRVAQRAKALGKRKARKTATA